MKIYAPVDNVNGIYASVLFVNSVGETDNPALIEWFKNHGYRVELGDITEPIAPIYNAPTWEAGGNESVEETKPDFESMSPDELRNWMREHGYGAKIKNTRSKDKLLEIVKG